MVQVAVRVSVVSTVADEAASLWANIPWVVVVELKRPAPVMVSDAPELVKVAAMATIAFDEPPVPVELVQVAEPNKGVESPAESAGSLSPVSSSATAVADSSNPIYLKPTVFAPAQTVLPAAPVVAWNNSLEAQFSPLFTTTLSPWE